MRVSVAGDAAGALRQVERDAPDLVMLDVMLPGASGFDLCGTIRQVSRVPVIFITARANEDDRLRGFELGADDYVTKPFSPREVVARVRAVLRRVATTAPENVEVSVGEVILRTDALTVASRGRHVKLTPAEARLLTTLMSAPGRVWTRAQLVSRALGPDFEGTERTVDVHIKNLRQKLSDLPLRIGTTHGVGYRLEPVE